MSEFDLVIIGAGPSGLALAQCCTSISNLKILIIDKESDIGGCHRVRRIPYQNEMLFTEHGPRVYSSTYKVLNMLLEKMNSSFYDNFTPYNFNITSIGKETIWSTLTYSELLILIFEFIKLTINENHGIKITLLDFLKSQNFDTKAINIIDRICRLTDGAGSDKYTLNEFLQLFNQQFFYKLYQPKLPNDEGLFKLWKTYLEKKGVVFMLNSFVDKLNISPNSKIVSHIDIISNDKIYKINGKKFIIATPPKNLINILENTNVPNIFGDFNMLKKWSDDTAYIDYLSVTFHWNNKIQLPKIYGFPKTSWGVAYIILSDYMTFKESNSQTVISAAVTITNNISLKNNKIPDQCTKDELIEEIFNQLKESFPDLPNPTVSLLSPGVKYKNNNWISEDTAFITTSNYSYLPFESNIITNLYNLGTHNGKQRYNFTSMESAVTNSVELSYILFPELKNEYPIQTHFKVTSFVKYFIIFILVLLFFKNKRLN